MDQTRLHLIIGHFPVYGSLLGAVVLSYGMWAGSSSTKRSAYIVFMLSAAGSLLAYLSGEGVKDIVKAMVETPGNSIRNHRNFALLSLIASSGMGILSVICLFRRFRSRSVSRTLAGITLFLALITFALSAWTGYLGLQIRHTEMDRTGATSGPNTTEARTDTHPHPLPW